MNDKLTLVIPCYNEESIIDNTIQEVLVHLNELISSGKISTESNILLVDDGSTDKTWERITVLCKKHLAVRGIKLSRNSGHQTALIAGLMEAKEKCDVTISLDADLQDDINVLKDFIDEYNRGSDIVYGVRSDRSSDSFFKRASAEFFYRILSFLGVKSIFNHADYRLMSKRSLNILSQYKETNLYIRGIIPLIGFKHSIVLYKRKPTERPTHYSFLKMLQLALDGVTSFSIKPLRFIFTLGVLMFFVSLFLLGYAGYVKLYGNTVPGWTSLMFTVLFLGGIQLFCIGIVGEYIGKIYSEVKERPRYIIEKDTHINSV
ncbi:MAG: glycosyltransferase family 2 protein [Bacteroidales bacterium]|nr:glycosyltransferase family 2 protein [Bacteroidales bacterium]